MDEILKQLASGKKAHVTAFVVLGVFLGAQYADLKSRLTRIEDRLVTLETRHIASK